MTHMEVSKPNENGVLDTGHREIVASHGRANAAIEFALSEDAHYRFSVEMHYSYGGFSGPICITDIGYRVLAEARTAALEYLLKRWHEPQRSYPASVHDELRMLREQVEGQLCQPSLF